MAAPTAPTSTSLITEAMNRCGESSPSATLLARGVIWLEEIKNDIWNKAKILKSLQNTSALVIAKGRSRYSMPTDYAGNGDISMRLAHGSITGTAVTGASTSITLAATDTSTEDYMLGKEILITAGTGLNSISQCTAFNTTTKVATVSPTWATTPVLADTYMVIEQYYPLSEGPIWDFDQLSHPETKVRPDTFHPVGDVDYSEFYLSPCPDDTYGLILRYSVDLMTVDLASTLMTTLYKKYRMVWINGLMAKKWEDDDDGRQNSKKSEYFNALLAMIGNETYGNTLSNLQRRCGE